MFAILKRVSSKGLNKKRTLEPKFKSIEEINPVFTGQRSCDGSISGMSEDQQGSQWGWKESAGRSMVREVRQVLGTRMLLITRILFWMIYRINYKSWAEKLHDLIWFLKEQLSLLWCDYVTGDTDRTRPVKSLLQKSRNTFLISSIKINFSKI